MSATAQASNNLLLCDVILKDLQALHDRLKVCVHVNAENCVKGYMETTNQNGRPL